jgi:ureidoacrylate peracid hydrolase
MSTSSVLLVIDMQRAFLDPTGSLAGLGLDVSGPREAIPGCVALVAAARTADVPVIYARMCLRPDYRDGGIIFNDLAPGVHEAGAMVGGTRDAEIVDELAPRPEDFIVDKPRFSAFYATVLEAVLSSLGVRRLVLCGVLTNVCVESTARDAAQRNFETIVVADASGADGPERHTRGLATLGEVFCRVRTVDDVVGDWTQPPPA